MSNGGGKTRWRRSTDEVIATTVVVVLLSLEESIRIPVQFISSYAPLILTMASRGDSAGSFRPRSRRSIAHVPRSRLTSTIDKENSTTDIGAIQPPGNTAKTAGKDKKSRSKSLGPGGLDALQNSNGNRRKSTTAFPVKGILKPTVPVSPVQNIPSFEETRKQTPARGSQQNEGNDQEKEGLLIDLDTPARPPDSNAEDTANPFDDFNASSAIAAAREKEEREQRERERKAILEQREARRKSMGSLPCNL